MGLRRASAPETFSAETLLAELARACGGRAALARRGGEGFLAEWDALAREREAPSFLESLLGLAERQERAGHLELAGEIYAAVVGANLGPRSRREDEASGGGALGHDGGGRTQGSPLQQRAQRRLDAILGRGDNLARAEFLGRRLAAEACDPAVLAAMGLAGLAFRTARLATLSRLAISPAETLWTRGLGARLLSGGAGFLLEAPTFTLAHRGADALLDREVDLSREALFRDFASGALTLLSLRLAGGLSQAALGRWAIGGGLGAQAARTILPQAAMFGGLLLSHRLETQLGLRAARGDATAATDALAALLSFQVGGRLAHHAFGETAAARERALEGQVRILDALNAPSPARTERSSLRRGLAWGPALTALGLGLHTLLAPGQVQAQDHGSVFMFDPISIEVIGGLITLAGGGVAYGLKRLYDYYRGEPKVLPDFFQRHRGTLFNGLGGPPPADAPLAGELQLVAERLNFNHEDTLYRTVGPEELMAALSGASPTGQGPMRSNARFAVRRKGPRVFDIGVDLANGTFTRILELTHPLPQTPLPERAGEDETLLRIGQHLDLQQFADALQKPVLALPLLPGSEYRLGVPLYHASAGYVLPTYTRGVRGVTAEQLRALGTLGGLLASAATEPTAPRPFLIESDGSGYLAMDWQSAHVESVPRSLQNQVQREGIRVNGQPLAGGRSSRPLSNGDRIQIGGAELLWIAPRPGFRLALIRAEEPRVEAVGDGGRFDRDPRGPLGDLADLFSNAESRLPRQVIPPELLERYRAIYPAPLLRLPDLVFEAENGTRILLSPRLKGGDPIPVGTNPGPGGIYLHGAWNPRARRYEIAGGEVEFFLLQDGEAYLFQAAPRAGNEAPLRLLRGEGGAAPRELPLVPENRVELQDGDVIEFGPLGQRTRLRWFRNLDAQRSG
ncbi:MAG: hypothetical protein IT572_04525 [Deltaproteobacteria bacterium]|nr:hypothetical protein [Deltaproteobacteria bacterium]